MPSGVLGYFRVLSDPDVNLVYVEEGDQKDAEEHSHYEYRFVQVYPTLACLTLTVRIRDESAQCLIEIIAK